MNSVSTEVAGTVLDERSTAGLWLDPPCHHVVVARRRTTLPIEEIVAVLRSFCHEYPERQVRIRAVFDPDFRSANLDPQLRSVKHVVAMNCELSGEFALLHDVRDDIAGTGVLAAGAGSDPLTEITRLEIRLEDHLSR